MLWLLLALSQTAPARDTFPDTWVTVDGLGRPVSSAVSHRAPAPNKTVGMFYFLANHVPGAQIYDNTNLLAADPAHPAFGPYGSAHWWGEPWFGYYQSDDPAVIRKHMQMLSDAGIDVLIFDNTNGPTYPDVYIPLCKVLEEMKAQGNRIPKIAFFTGHGAWNTIYNDLYAKNLYSDLWFQWKGKPLMMAHYEAGDKMPDNLAQFFSVRESWAWTPSQWFGDGHDKWPWLDNFPQNFGWHEDSHLPEQVSVTVGQHATSSIGRSSLAQHEPPVDALSLTPRTPFGDCFAQQIERGLQIDPEFIFITGWNEWTATRFKQEQAGTMAGRPMPVGGSFFVDEYNAEFSRDIEPAKGLLSDNYYYQLADFVRRYKGVRTLAPNTARTIDVSKGLDQWFTVQPEYRDEIGDPVHRDHAGWGNLTYKNDTGRNDIVTAKVAYDKTNVYFYVRTAAPLTPPTDSNWMLLYLNVDADYKTGWLGYDFVVNRSLGILQKNKGNRYEWTDARKVPYKVAGNELMLSVPRAVLGIKGRAATIDFKWADNIQQTGEVSDFTLNGDAAPNDRFNYRATIGP